MSRGNTNRAGGQKKRGGKNWQQNPNKRDGRLGSTNGKQNKGKNRT